MHSAGRLCVCYVQIVVKFVDSYISTDYQESMPNMVMYVEWNSNDSRAYLNTE